MPFKALKDPLLRVVGGDLDPVDDCFVLSMQNHATCSRFGDCHLPRESLLRGLQSVDLGLECSQPADGTALCDFQSADAAAAVVFAAVLPVVVGAGRHGVAPPTTAPTTFLVEGRVALTVPANWTPQRVLAGPGSARVQVTSPADPEAALHVTQSPVPPDETIGVTANRLQRAIGSEPDGVFVDFDPSGISAGRPAVTYREVRASHQVRWTVVVDGPVRISIGCQSRPGGEDAVRDVCEQAVRTAHTIR